MTKCEFSNVFLADKVTETAETLSRLSGMLRDGGRTDRIENTSVAYMSVQLFELAHRLDPDASKRTEARRPQNLARAIQD